jgi:hypothetical protein
MAYIGLLAALHELSAPAPPPPHPGHPLRFPHERHEADLDPGCLFHHTCGVCYHGPHLLRCEPHTCNSYQVSLPTLTAPPPLSCTACTPPKVLLCPVFAPLPGPLLSQLRSLAEAGGAPPPPPAPRRCPPPPPAASPLPHPCVTRLTPCITRCNASIPSLQHSVPHPLPRLLAARPPTPPPSTLRCSPEPTPRPALRPPQPSACFVSYIHSSWATWAPGVLRCLLGPVTSLFSEDGWRMDAHIAPGRGGYGLVQ